MPDMFDHSQELQQLQLEHQIAAARTNTLMPSAFICADCDSPIPEARRAALPGVQCCVHCQQIREIKRKHIRV
ncbi:TraR/DksA family transcriptional regulator [Yersinia enterocolitica]|uniref:TraR/DksA family transcriptional regulator n=1 Tax=Yersinia proxima TaxID=2890316 RepID=UPI0005DB0925|nr:TraR/DksA family transcriptional regulator [Yersinia proxima]EKN3444749.1 TraR/DksA family transcriptional regulator [Yersinia enterocolitica]CNC63859.1 DnaK suppressor protein [Yersinia frederiksenii]EKN4797902.1 TraR/DksA family transcriptional regulator [Yersinia enterocolitica]EKN5108339.1 TraR/DksA family transcriptional regulator [Yersinia enterocolitica]ELI8201597.1 TraR/DksA family transcriptional regulator [Yersinia enterocolitica]